MQRSHVVQILADILWQESVLDDASVCSEILGAGLGPCGEIRGPAERQHADAPAPRVVGANDFVRLRAGEAVGIRSRAAGGDHDGANGCEGDEQ